MKDSTQNGALLNIYATTNMGNIRKNNEDAMFAEGIGVGIGDDLSSAAKLFDDELRVFAVCDGMGGEEFGEEASKIATTLLKSHLNDIKNAENLLDAINAYVKHANDEIVKMVKEKGIERSGSTLAMVCIYNGVVYPFNVGDSRVYFYSEDGEFKQISVDQTLAMKKLMNNIYDEETAKNSPDSHKLTSFLGVDSRGIGLKAVPSTPFNMGNGKIIICSDGLTDMCSDEEIKTVVFSSKYPSKDLVAKALQNGGKDNVTCVVISRDESVVPPPKPDVPVSKKKLITAIASAVAAVILVIIGALFIKSKLDDKNTKTSSKSKQTTSQTASKAQSATENAKKENATENSDAPKEDGQENDDTDSQDDLKDSIKDEIIEEAKNKISNTTDTIKDFAGNPEETDEDNNGGN